MTASLNKEFRKQMGGEFHAARMPTTYLMHNVFDYNLHPSVLSLMPGVYVFDIVQSGPGNLLQFRAVTGSGHAGAFSAYWCPYTPKGAHSVVLGTQAQYFFTPPLTGCILEINVPAVTHHGGSIYPWPPNSLNGLPWGGRVGHRKWDNNQMSPTGHVNSNVIGVRTSGGWKFYQQSFDFNPNVPLARQVVSEI